LFAPAQTSLPGAKGKFSHFLDVRIFLEAGAKSPKVNGLRGPDEIMPVGFFAGALAGEFHFFAAVFFEDLFAVVLADFWVVFLTAVLEVFFTASLARDFFGW
jgi:hypothetical protein